MTVLRRMLRKKGFTLIELLVVIAIIATLAALLTPVVTTALLRGRITQMLNNGREMYRLLLAKDLENPLGLKSRSAVTWPTTADAYPDSTEYFKTWVTNDSFDINYAFFAGPGLDPASDETAFLDTELRNAWCIALDVDPNTMFGCPVFFTQNIDLPSSTLTDFDEDAPMTDGALPFGERACVIVAVGGAAFSLDSDTALATNFNPYGFANTVLYPKNGQY